MSGAVRRETKRREEEEMILQTKRLLLRPWKESDAQDLYRYARDPQVGPRAGWPVHTSVENSRQIIRTVLAREGTFAVVLQESGEVIGSIGLMPDTELVHGPDERELGYWIGVPFWGRGLIPEACRKVLRWGFEDLSLRRIWCAYYDGNVQSARVQEKLGLTPVRTEMVDVSLLGERRRNHVNVLEREVWSARQQAE